MSVNEEKEESMYHHNNNKNNNDYDDEPFINYEADDDDEEGDDYEDEIELKDKSKQENNTNIMNTNIMNTNTRKRKDSNNNDDDENHSKRTRVANDENDDNNNNMKTTIAAATIANAATTNNNNDTITSSNSAHGVYIPPFRRKQMQLLQQQQQKEEGEIDINNDPQQQQQQQQQPKQTKQTTTVSIQEQRQKWEDLKKAINGTINRLNISTIKDLIHSLFQNANLIRGKGLLVKAVLRAATTSPTYAQVYASLIAVLNTKLPEIGELVLTRSILLFRKSYARQDRSLTTSIVNFIGCLFNQGLCHELLCLQLLTVLLDGDPTDDSVEVAVQLTKVIGMSLSESSPAGIHAVMERFRHLLHDGSIGRRVQYKVEELISIRKNRFKDYPALMDELDLVERDEQIMFELSLDDDDLKKEEELDVFKVDDNFIENENDWIAIRKEILGDDSDDDDDDDSNGGSGDSETGDSDDYDEDEDGSDNEDGILEESPPPTSKNQSNNQQVVIHDMTEKDLVNLRRKIYLTIMSAATFEECAHKLAKLSIPDGREMELINMIIECCSQERTFLRYYGLIASRFCLMNHRWRQAFLEAFEAQYNTIHRLETNKLRNVAKLFAHLLHTDSLPWSCLSVIHLNEDETTSSSRIFLKIVVQEMAEALGIGGLVKRFESDDPEVLEWFKEMFPKDNPRKTRYAINFFTSIGLGPLTDGLREHLKNAPKLIMMQAEEEAKRKALEDASSSDDSSSVSSTSSSSTSSMSSSTSDSSSSSSSYTSTSSSSDSSTSSVSHRRRRGRKQGSSRRNNKRGRRRGRSYSSSESDSESDRDRRKKSDRKKTTRQRSSRSQSVSSKESASERREKRRGNSRKRMRSASYSSRSR